MQNVLFLSENIRIGALFAQLNISNIFAYSAVYHKVRRYSYTSKVRILLFVSHFFLNWKLSSVKNDLPQF